LGFVNEKEKKIKPMVPTNRGTPHPGWFVGHFAKGKMAVGTVGWFDFFFC